MAAMDLSNNYIPNQLTLQICISVQDSFPITRSLCILCALTCTKVKQ